MWRLSMTWRQGKGVSGRARGCHGVGQVRGEPEGWLGTGEGPAGEWRRRDGPLAGVRRGVHEMGSRSVCQDGRQGFQGATAELLNS